MRYLVLLALCSVCAAQESIDLVRDKWGVPHVFATSDAGAMFGFGRAVAEDRLFQMYLGLRVMQGRLAETIGNGRRTALESDRKMRTFGWWRHAQVVAKNMGGATRALLDAYCRGVNSWRASHELPAMFARYELDPEPWTPAACLVSWWHVAQFFGTDGTRDLNAWRNLIQPRPGREPPPSIAPEDDVAVVRRSDVTDEWVARVARFVAEHHMDRGSEAQQPVRKFSHAWVVGGKKTTTGAAVLVSDPQTPVTNPSLFYEFHVRGKTFDARGIGVAGSPILLIGFNRDVAWGMTARGADQADLWRLTTDRARPGFYELDGQWRKLPERREVIRVRGGKPQELVIRESAFGPVVSEFSFVGSNGPEVAMRRVPLCDTRVETVQGAFAMMRAKSVTEFAQAVHGWRFPSANCVFGDRHGSIGYATIGAIPVRSREGASNGRYAHDGSSLAFDWEGFVPGDLMPQVIDPTQGFLLSANHRPIASFYKIPIGNSTGSSGDTLRSWRLRELLVGKQRFTPQDVLAIHHDTTDAALRDIVRIGLALRGHDDLFRATRSALDVLAPWFEAGAKSDLRSPGAALATLISINFRRNATPLTGIYGGGQSGLARLLRAARSSLPRVRELEREWVEDILADAWRAAKARYGSDPEQWDAHARADVKRRRLGYFAGLDGFPSLDPNKDVLVPALTCVDGNTIASQAAQSYTQWVPMHDVDAALSICPIGQSEVPGSDSRLATYELWAQGRLHPAPLSREAVDKIRASTVRLQY